MPEDVITCEARIADLLRVSGSESAYMSMPPSGRSGRMYGGEVLGQAVMAAAETLPSLGRVLHHAHVQFVRPADANLPVTHEVSRVRDGGSFSARSVRATQDGRLVATVQLSFHQVRPGLRPAAMHQASAPGMRTPEVLAAPHLALELDDDSRAWLAGLMRRIPVDLRLPAEPLRPFGSAWLRTNDKITGPPHVHDAAVLYLTDLFMISAALGQHEVRIDNAGLHAATVSHSVWLHRRLPADEWFLHDLHSDWAGDGRALTRGQVFDAQSRLCATTVQESVVRW